MERANPWCSKTSSLNCSSLALDLEVNPCTMLLSNTQWSALLQVLKKDALCFNPHLLQLKNKGNFSLVDGPTHSCILGPCFLLRRRFSGIQEILKEFLQPLKYVLKRGQQLIPHTLDSNGREPLRPPKVPNPLPEFPHISPWLPWTPPRPEFLSLQWLDDAETVGAFQLPQDSHKSARLFYSLIVSFGGHHQGCEFLKNQRPYGHRFKQLSWQ